MPYNIVKVWISIFLFKYPVVLAIAPLAAPLFALRNQIFVLIACLLSFTFVHK